jgi:ABC-2 type transport system permease protein
VALPLLLLSGVLLPIALAPDWLQAIANVNPLYHAVEAMRALFDGRFGDTTVIVGLAWLVVLAIVSVAISARTFNRATA